MQTLDEVTNYLIILAGLAAVLMILVTIFKIMLGDEGDSKKYLNRIKNGLIAFILVISISNIKTMILNYFPYEESSTAIGDFSGIKTSILDGTLEEKYEDVQGREVIKVDDQYYVKTDEKKVNLGSWINSFKINVGIYKLFDDCQGLTKGSVAEDKYYVCLDEKEVDAEYKGFLFSADLKGEIKSKDDFYDVMGDWKEEKYQQYTVIE